MRFDSARILSTTMHENQMLGNLAVPQHHEEYSIAVILARVVPAGTRLFYGLPKGMSV